MVKTQFELTCDDLRSLGFIGPIVGIKHNLYLLGHYNVSPQQVLEHTMTAVNDNAPT